MTARLSRLANVIYSLFSLSAIIPEPPQLDSGTKKSCETPHRGRRVKKLLKSSEKKLLIYDLINFSAWNIKKESLHYGPIKATHRERQHEWKIENFQFLFSLCLREAFWHARMTTGDTKKKDEKLLASKFFNSLQRFLIGVRAYGPNNTTKNSQLLMDFFFHSQLWQSIVWEIFTNFSHTVSVGRPFTRFFSSLRANKSNRRVRKNGKSIFTAEIRN